MRVAQIVGTHGLRGQLKVEPMTDFVERLEKGNRLILDGNWVEVVDCVWHKGRPLLKLTGYDDINQAETLKWHYLEIPAGTAPELEEDEYVTADLIGLEVRTVDGQVLGKIDDVLAYPAHDIFEVGEILIPVVKEFVKEIDLEEQVVIVELIEGMIP